MKDPFPLEPLPWLSKSAQPWADLLSLPTLPYHIHEILAAAVLYTVVYWPLSPILSTLAVGDRYRSLPRRRRVNWDAHVVSMVQSTLINTLSLWIIFADHDRATMDAEARVWGYTGACAMVQALAAGYFLWDLIVTSCNMDVFGLGTLAHAVSALIVYSFGFRPFVNYYAPVFILWELSTPFLNIHWFFDKVGMTGTRAQLYNGLALLATFFSARLVYGTYQSYRVFSDIWAAVGTSPGPARFVAAAETVAHIANETLAGGGTAAGGTPQSAISGGSDDGLSADSVMRFVTADSTVPVWLGSAYLASNLILNFLNFYWFYMMIRAVRKRFQKPATDDKETKKKDKNEAIGGAVVVAGEEQVEKPVDTVAAAQKPRRRKA